NRLPPACCTRLLAIPLLLLGGLGCGGTRPIETAPPRPAPSIVPPRPPDTGRATLVIQVATGGTPLPADVQALRFRLAEVRLKARGGAWTSYPADAGRFQITAEARPRKTVLSTRLPPVPYDSLALVLEDVFVQYGPNAGGPLTLTRGEPLRLAHPLAPIPDQTTTLHLTFEPGASLSRDAACRWFFLPFITARVE
ncbi:MAG: hypothetical protein D6685_10265, partial [Bacteroidetes bacterium]